MSTAQSPLESATATKPSASTQAPLDDFDDLAPKRGGDISIAHSPDSDDAFMFYGLATNKVRVPGFKFHHTLTDIETLNRRAIDEAFYDVTAISFHAYPYMQDNYALMACGGSVGEGRPLAEAAHALDFNFLCVGPACAHP